MMGVDGRVGWRDLRVDMYVPLGWLPGNSLIIVLLLLRLVSDGRHRPWMRRGEGGVITDQIFKSDETCMKRKWIINNRYNRW